jgi:hypothetical protein
MAGIKPNRADIAELGVGGLLGPGVNVLFPPYGENDGSAQTKSA